MNCQSVELALSVVVRVDEPISVLCSGEPSDSWRSLENMNHAELAGKAMIRLHGMFGDGMTGR
jgi:hypothetical protein